jgi:hypothetical protein
MLQGGSTKDKRRKLGILFTFCWGIWNERNRRVFQAKEKSAVRLAYLIIDDVHLIETAGLL